MTTCEVGNKDQPLSKGGRHIWGGGPITESITQFGRVCWEIRPVERFRPGPLPSPHFATYLKWPSPDCGKGGGERGEGVT